MGKMTTEYNRFEGYETFSGIQRMLICFLYDNGAQSLKDLVEKLKVATTTVRDNLNILVDREVIEKFKRYPEYIQPGRDRKVNHFRITKLHRSSQI